MKLAAALVLAALPFAALAQQPDSDITYKGLALGASMQEFSAKFPDYTCRSGTRCHYDSVECKGSPFGITSSKEAFDAFNRRGDECRDRNSFGGAYVDYADAFFQDGHLYKVDFTIPSSHIDSLIKAVTTRYGQPQETDDTPVRNRMGASFPNVSADWERGGTHLYVVRHLGRIGSGTAILDSVESRRRAIESQKSGAEKKARDF